MTDDYAELRRTIEAARDYYASGQTLAEPSPDYTRWTQNSAVLFGQILDPVAVLLADRDRLHAVLREMHADVWNVERGDHRPGDHPDQCYACAALVGHGLALVTVAAPGRRQDVGSEMDRAFGPDAAHADTERIAHFLWDLLDAIDTASDMAKSDDAAYRRLVERIHGRRFQVGVTDGYTVVWKGDPQPPGFDPGPPPAAVAIADPTPQGRP